jgi:hypothetical protein
VVGEMIRSTGYPGFGGRAPKAYPRGHELNVNRGMIG